MINKYMTLFALLAGFGCSSLGPQFQAQPNRASDKAIVYIYRVKHFAGSIGSPDIKIDNVIYGALANGSYLPIEISTGVHKIELLGMGTTICAMDFNLKSATDYYLRFDASMSNGSKESTYNTQQAVLGPGGGGALGAAMATGFYASNDEKNFIFKAADLRVKQPLSNPGFLFVQPEHALTEIKDTRLGKFFKR